MATSSSTTHAPTARRRWLRVAALLVPAILFVSVLGVATLRKVDNLGPGSKAPEFTAPRLGQAGSITLSSLRGKPVLLNFWASWCGPCKDEAPMLRQAYAAYGSRVHFLGVDESDAESAALAFERSHHVTYPSVVDEGLQLYQDYGLTGRPESFFIDQNGVIVQHIPGPLTRQGLFDLLDLLVRRDA